MKKIIELHTFMLEELDKLVQDFQALQKKKERRTWLDVRHDIDELVAISAQFGRVCPNLG